MSDKPDPFESLQANMAEHKASMAEYERLRQLDETGALRRV
jgi:hypothetical protein